jgi:hypothetical protein
MSSAMPHMTGIVRSARKTPPTPLVSAMVCVTPNRRGTSKSTSVAGCPPTWIMFSTTSASSSAARRSRQVSTVAAPPNSRTA